MFTLERLNFSPLKSEKNKVYKYQISSGSLPYNTDPGMFRITSDSHHLALEERGIEPKKNQCGYYYNNSNLSLSQKDRSVFK